jgi:hypothetical protein
MRAHKLSRGVSGKFFEQLGKFLEAVPFISFALASIAVGCRCHVFGAVSEKLYLLAFF